MSYGNSISTQTAQPKTVGSISSNVALTSVAYGRDYVVSAAVTVTLPSLASGASSNRISFFNDTASLTATLAAQGADAIRVNGTNQVTLALGPGDSIFLEHNGSSWSMATTSVLKGSTVSPAFTGTPTAPTAAQNTNTTQVATTAFVLGQASGTTPAMNGIGQAGAATTFARADHVHPTDTNVAPLVSPAFTGTPTAPTATAGTNTTQVATTAFVGTAVTGFKDTTHNFTANQRPNYTNSDTVSTTSSYTYDGSTKGQINLVTLTNAITVTFANPTNIIEGALYIFLLKAGDTSARTFAWGSNYQNTPPSSGTAVTGKADVVSFIGGAGNTLIYSGGTTGV